MTRNKTAPFVFGLLVMGVIGVATMMKLRQEPRTADVTDAAANIATSQHEGMQQGSATDDPRRQTGVVGSRLPTPNGDAGELSPEERARLISAQIARLDDRFLAEPVNWDWALKHEKMIATAIVGTPTDNFPVAMPQSIEEQCRSSMCRITMTYADEEEALQMQSKLTLGLGGAISRARSFYVPTKDGGTQLIVFAGRSGSLL